MKFKRLYNRDQIESVLLSDCLLETTNEDGVLTIDAKKDCFLGAFDNEQLIGIAIFQPESRMTIEYHPNLLKRYRGENSKPFTIGALKWLVENAAQYKKVNAKFPAKFEHIKHYAEKCGFTYEGTDRQSCKLGDRLIYGITQEEIRGL